MKKFTTLAGSPALTTNAALSVLLGLLLFAPLACSSSAEREGAGESPESPAAGEKGGTAPAGTQQPAAGTQQPAAGQKPAAATSGCMVGNCQDGEGTYVWPSGSKYVGQFKGGLRNGKGAYTWPSGSRYLGEYKDGLREGKGAFTWADGANYVGDFAKDLKQGRGRYTWPDGSSFDGEFQNDQMGQGQKTPPPAQ